RVEPGVEISHVVGKPVVAARGTGLPHADENGRQTPAETGDVRDDVAPDVRRRRVPVEEHDRVARARVDVGDFGVEDLDALARVRIGDGQGSHGPIVSVAARHLGLHRPGRDGVDAHTVAAGVPREPAREGDDTTLAQRRLPGGYAATGLLTR